MRELTGQRAIISGATGGMGQTVARAFARVGIETALFGRNEDKLSALAEECEELGGSAITVTCDISKPDDIPHAVERAIKNLGGLNILFNAAGISKSGKAHEVDLTNWNAMLDTNLRAHYTLARYALPEINKTPGGAVIKIGSIAVAHATQAMQLVVSRALDGYADCLFDDVREFGTKVCTIRPGFVDTPLVNADNKDRTKMIAPEDIAETVLFVLRMSERTCPTEIVLRPQRTPYKK
ncbi:MAG: SDR family NAD(P)-dependent oxidoreductase [Rhodospirillales bacterium]|nr:SDR family NAD(P)-dependent oxidoreductase [Rhodospirillales bacterium]MBO6785509.1 SDR family NAD(P)-dependent oxidoreductase [Rhodospirillales bacterium]